MPSRYIEHAHWPLFRGFDELGDEKRPGNRQGSHRPGERHPKRIVRLTVVSSFIRCSAPPHRFRQPREILEMLLVGQEFDDCSHVMW